MQILFLPQDASQTSCTWAQTLYKDMSLFILAHFLDFWKIMGIAQRRYLAKHFSEGFLHLNRKQGKP